MGQDGYGKLIGGGIGTVIGIPLGIIVGRILGVEWPSVFDGVTVEAVKGLVQGGITMLGIYYTPHASVGGS
jgi:hypothetical protein